MAVVQYGPHLWEVCERCNYDRHVCFFCGDDLRHAEDTHRGPNAHACYVEDDVCTCRITQDGDTTIIDPAGCRYTGHMDPALLFGALR
jgi:hypothetical protein